MDYDRDKVDDCTLALMCLGFHSDGPVTRAWKGFDWDAMSRLYEKGFIYNPVGKAKSVVLTPEGIEQAEKLFAKMFADGE
jgi:hypothetical protein